VQHGCGQGGTATGFAVQHDLQVARLQSRVGAELELQHAARDVHGAAQMTGGKFVGLAHIHQHVGFANGLFGMVQGDFLHPGLGARHEVMGCFHTLLLVKLLSN